MYLKRGHQGGAPKEGTRTCKQARTLGGKRGQQEIVGFVIIVVLVVVALMFLLLYSLKPKTEIEKGDIAAENLLESILKKTTSCVVGLERRDIRELLTRCYFARTCENTGQNVCDFVSDEIETIMELAFETEGGTVEGLVFDFYRDPNRMVTSIEGFYTIYVGNCTNYDYREYEGSVAGVDDGRARLKIC